MYAKVFEQIFDSSISKDYLVRHVFMDLLVLADAEGVIDKTLDAIARRTNIPENIIKDCIQKLMQPDDSSRTPDHDGRRLKLISEHREWGWVIVNYAHYRAIRDEEGRRSYHRNYMKEKRARDQLVTHVNTCDAPLTDTEASTDSSTKEDKQAANATRAPKLSDSQFIDSLRSNVAYDGINIDVELGKMDAWLLLNPGRRKTQRWVLKWLNRIEKPMGANKQAQRVDEDGIVISSATR